MDKHIIFKTINLMLSEKYKYVLPFCEEARALICKFDSEKMYKLMSAFYTVQKSDEEFVKKSIASVKKETDRTIGFGR